MARRQTKVGRTERLELRLSTEEREAFDAAAEGAERTLTDWARRALVRAAGAGGLK